MRADVAIAFIVGVAFGWWLHSLKPANPPPGKEARVFDPIIPVKFAS